MTEQEKFNAEVQARLAVQDAKFNQFIEEMRDFKEEMRQQNEMRAAEMRQQNEMRAAETAEIRKTTDARIEKIESKLDNVTNHIQILTVTATAGMVAIAVAVFLK